MTLQRGDRSGLEVGAPVVGIEARVEALGVEIGDAYDVPGALERPQHAIAGGRDERVGDRMTVHDEDVHRSPAIFSSTRSRNARRSLSLDASMPYRASHVVRARRPHDIRSVRVIVRRPLSLISFTLHRADP
jgi:hypothetical protein